MRRGLMVTGLAVAAGALPGCGGNDCPTPTTTTLSPAAQEAQARAQAKERDQAAVDQMVSAAATHFVNQLVAAGPELDQELNSLGADGIFAKEPNFDGSDYTRLTIDQWHGTEGKNIQVTGSGVAAQYLGGHPGTVRDLVVYDSNHVFKKNPNGPGPSKGKHGGAHSNRAESKDNEYRFRLRTNGHWLVTQTTGGVYTNVFPEVKKVVTNPEAVQDIIDEDVEPVISRFTR